MAKKTNRIVIITGGASGIGLDTLKMFEKNGDTVYALALKNDGSVQNFYACDVSDEQLVKNIVQEIGNKHGRIDILINCAGYGMSGITELIDTQAAKKLFDVNVFGMQNCNKYALPFMQKGAKIINISSAMALFPVPYRAFYAASKAATSSLTFAQRNELWPLGIDMAAVCPGNVKSNFTKSRPKSFETNERYGDRMQKATEKIDAGDDQRMLPTVVAAKIFKLADKKRMPPQVIVGGKYKFIFFLARFVPVSWMQWAINKATG